MLRVSTALLEVHKKVISLIEHQGGWGTTLEGWQEEQTQLAPYALASCGQHLQVVEAAVPELIDHT